MDIFAHMLWGGAILRKSKQLLFVLLASLLPDIISFGPHMLGSVFNGETGRGMPPLHTLEPWVFASYNVTHSLVVCVVALSFVWIIWRAIPLWLFAWPLHVIIDIPTHSSAYFPTPFLWPVSDYYFSGIAWGTPWFILLNYIFIIIAYIWIFLYGNAHHRPRRG